MLTGNASHAAGGFALRAFAALAALASLSMPAQGSLIGDEIEIGFALDFFPSGVAIVETVTVGAGPEIVGVGGGFGSIAEILLAGESIDISGDTITMSFGSSINFDIGFSDLRWQDEDGEIVSLPAISGQTSLVSSGFTADSVSLTGVVLDGAGTVTIEFSQAVTHVSDQSDSRAVVEPGGLALFGVGLLGLGIAGWRRRKAGHNA